MHIYVCISVVVVRYTTIYLHTCPYIHTCNISWPLYICKCQYILLIYIHIHHPILHTSYTDLQDHWWTLQAQDWGTDHRADWTWNKKWGCASHCGGFTGTEPWQACSKDKTEPQDPPSLIRRQNRSEGWYVWVCTEISQDVLWYPQAVMYLHIPGMYWIYQTNAGGLQTVFFNFGCRRLCNMHGTCMHASSILTRLGMPSSMKNFASVQSLV